MDAVVALRSFIDAFDSEGLQQVKPLIPQLLEVFFHLMQQVSLGLHGLANLCALAAMRPIILVKVHLS